MVDGEWTGQSACCTSLETLLPASQLGAATGWKDGASGLTCVTCPSVVRPVDIQRERDRQSHWYNEFVQKVAKLSEVMEKYDT